MARRARTKPVAEHIATQEEQPTEHSTAALGEPTTEVTPAPDIFDQVIAARQADQVPPETLAKVEAAMEAAPVVRASELQQEPRPESLSDHGEQRTRHADPLPFASITLGESNNAPKMRLFRSQRFQQMALQFDEKPDVKYTEMLREAGYRWRGDDKVWTRQINRTEKWKSHADAERIFSEIGNSIRADKGLEPVAMMGMGA
jgi:hypothetical protein